MNKAIIPSLTLILLLTSSCQKEYDLNQYIIQDTPIIRRVATINYDGFTEIKIDTIDLNPETWLKITEFTFNNQTGWKSTLASFNADYSFHQGDFRLLGWNDHHSIVIGFKDEKGISRQLTKEINEGEVDFLLNYKK